MPERPPSASGAEAQYVATLIARCDHLIRWMRRRRNAFTLLLDELLDVHERVSRSGGRLTRQDRRMIRHLARAVRAVESEAGRFPWSEG